MTVPEFQSYVERHANWFQGAGQESPDSLDAAEQAVGCTLPESLRWLLSHWGYSAACGVTSLEEAVQATLRCRRNCGLPQRFLILNDWQDAGVVWIDRAVTDPEGESPIFWASSHNLLRLCANEPLGEDVDVFASYPAWVQFRLEEAQEEGF